MHHVTYISTFEEFCNLWNNANGKLVDIRKTDDFDKGHLPNAENVDVMSHHFVEYFSVLNRNTKVFLYCTDGTRVKVAAGILAEMGFTSLCNLTKGIKECRGITKV